MGQKNRRDFARRMLQFFDHYLMDGPLPVWMAEGLPAVDKGKKFGFETAEAKPEVEEAEAEEPESEEAEAKESESEESSEGDNFND